MAGRKAPRPVVEFSYSSCRITVFGTDTKCWMCGQVVPSGTEHECERNGGITTRRNRAIAETR